MQELYGSVDRELTTEEYMERGMKYIHEKVDSIIKHFNPVKIILFGSFARGTPDRWSDMDLLVVQDSIKKGENFPIDIKNAVGFNGMADDILTITPKELDRLKDDVGFVYYYILREGKILYER